MSAAPGKGELIVIAVRAEQLAWHFRNAIAGRFWSEDVAPARWHAQRLRSACERAIGVRERYADRIREGKGI
jgi:porphobilinogen deaminase